MFLHLGRVLTANNVPEGTISVTEEVLSAQAVLFLHPHKLTGGRGYGSFTTGPTLCREDIFVPGCDSIKVLVNSVNHEVVQPFAPSVMLDLTLNSGQKIYGTF